MSSHPDHQYIEALRRGDFSVLDDIYRSHGPTVSSWVQKNSGSVDDAQDIFQEGIIALHQKANDPDFVLTCPIGALLFRICQNKWLYALRKIRREAEVRKIEVRKYDDERTMISQLEAIEEEQLRQERLDRTFRQLSELCQQLMRLLMTGIKPAAAATQLGMTDANTVYRRKHACEGRWRTLYQALVTEG
ncbi:RNA polymerase sigma factor [Lewinella sp. W8]|uniref:RNA polymerase sigma factor n=1 Tax=Lewinella sp. W8 TaxID=2528208 RepID=UPI0010684121|nr:sigma-70 family RNA polymerase sigma factor [Lewinella sp. W8]MTB53817.1 sigma-70 family RNA polymerase sigma factor [Lewinella sp. W8]